MRNSSQFLQYSKMIWINYSEYPEKFWVYLLHYLDEIFWKRYRWVCWEEKEVRQ